MKKKVSVTDLEFGVYVSELDRPWTETPFQYQGFKICHQEELETLKKYCQHVTIDLDKGIDLTDLRPRLDCSTVTPPATQNPILRDDQSRKIVYKEINSLESEFVAAKKIKNNTESLLKKALFSAATNAAIPIEILQDSVNQITDSVIRNPSAMMLLARLGQKTENALNRALGVSILMIAFGRFLQLSREQLETLGMAGLLQDIGMTIVPEEILEKKGPLNNVEMTICRSHVMYSVRILENSAVVNQKVLDIVSKHHERHHGSGYPKSLAGNEIGLLGSIAGLADFYDALTRPRPYAETFAPSNALNHIYGARNILFDGALVEQFIQCLGIFPVGSFVEMNSGEIGLVIADNSEKRLLPKVMVIIDAQGSPMPIQLILDLSKEPHVAPRVPYRIKRTLNQDTIPLNTLKLNF